MPTKNSLKQTSDTIAVISSGDKQSVVHVGDRITVPLRVEDVGTVVTLADLLGGSAVSAVVLEHTRLPKIYGRLFHNKVRGSRYPRGHRQSVTKLEIQEIK